LKRGQIDKGLNHVRQLLHEINEAHGFQFTVREGCSGGVIGAWLITDPVGRRAILMRNNDTAHRMTRLPAIVDRIRATGYPTPAWLASGVAANGSAYDIVDFAPGEPLSTPTLNKAITTQLIDVIERQARLNPIRPKIGPPLSGHARSRRAATIDDPCFAEWAARV
jgi:hypothetical protein